LAPKSPDTVTEEALGACRRKVTRPSFDTSGDTIAVPVHAAAWAKAVDVITENSANVSRKCFIASRSVLINSGTKNLT
jgi:hypothetical protein